jgi:small subunit ribosomal protein S14
MAELPRNGTRPASATGANHRPSARLLPQVPSCPRIELRDLANKGLIPGVVKSSW